jgi:methylmalonyl-CoA mutase cobalamin-binding subunit
VNTFVSSSLVILIGLIVGAAFQPRVVFLAITMIAAGNRDLVKRFVEAFHQAGLTD